MALSAPASAQGASGDAVIGTVVSVYKDVKILRGRNWEQVQEGLELKVSDEVRTGRRGRCRIELKDRLEEGNRGPTVINVGSDSQVKMEKFEVSFDDPKKSEGILDLIRGTVRAFTKNWGARSVFSVRTGTSLCGIRGSEEMIKYDGGNADGSQGKTFQSCYSGNCMTLNDQTPGTGRPLSIGFQRFMPSSNPTTWRDFKLTSGQKKAQITGTQVPGNNGQTEEEQFRSRFGSEGGDEGAGAGAGGGASESWMGVRWTPEGLPDCKAEIGELILNTYRWDEIKDYREFTFYRDELVNDRFVVSGKVQTACPGELLSVLVSVDGGGSWVRALYSKETNTFRYEFDPSAFSELDLRVRPTFKKDLVDQYRQSQSGN